MPIEVLGTPAGMPPVVFAALNVGTASPVLGLLVGHPWMLRGGGAVLACAGLVYAAGAGRTLLFVLRDPRRPWSGLSVLPG